MKKIFVCGCLFVVLLGVFIYAYEHGLASGRPRAEREHGILLPSSARNIQCRAESSVLGLVGLDHVVFSLFEMDSSDLQSFTNSLIVTTRNRAGEVPHPGMHPDNCWWHFSPEYNRFRKTWDGDAKPMETLTCKSPVGDFLQVELWMLTTNTLVVKMYTDWN